MLFRQYFKTAAMKYKINIQITAKNCQNIEFTLSRSAGMKHLYNRRQLRIHAENPVIVPSQQTSRLASDTNRPLNTYNH